MSASWIRFKRLFSGSSIKDLVVDSCLALTAEDQVSLLQSLSPSHLKPNPANARIFNDKADQFRLDVHFRQSFNQLPPAGRRLLLIYVAFSR